MLWGYCFNYVFIRITAEFFPLMLSPYMSIPITFYIPPEKPENVSFFAMVG